MKLKELIKELSKYDEETDVLVKEEMQVAEGTYSIRFSCIERIENTDDTVYLYAITGGSNG